jgi:hypothetical protein
MYDRRLLVFNIPTRKSLAEVLCRPLSRPKQGKCLEEAAVSFHGSTDFVSVKLIQILFHANLRTTKAGVFGKRMLACAHLDRRWYSPPRAHAAKPPPANTAEILTISREDVRGSRSCSFGTSSVTENTSPHGSGNAAGRSGYVPGSREVHAYDFLPQGMFRDNGVGQWEEPPGLLVDVPPLLRVAQLTHKTMICRSRSVEQIFDRDKPLHLFIIARYARVCTRVVEMLVTGLLRERIPDLVSPT